MATVIASLTNLTALLSHVTAAATQAEEQWRLCHPDCRKTLIYARTTSGTLPVCDMSLRTVRLPAPEAGDFVESTLL